MGRRQQKRYRIALPVTVFGRDSNGNPFSQSATTVEISRGGVRLSGLRCLGARGDPVQVKYKGQRGHYRVAWIGQPGTPWDGLAGLEGMAGAKFLFAEHLPAGSAAGAEADTYVAPEAAPPPAVADHAAVDRRQEQRRQQPERRRHPRFHCAGTVRLWEHGNDMDIAGRVNEISLCGCYVEMMSPLRVGTGLRMELAVNNHIIRLEGIVRVSQPSCGMGVEFIQIAPVETEKLRRVVAELSGAATAASPQAAEPPPAAVDSIPSKELGSALLLWFGAHDTLTRRDFLDLIEHLKHATEELHPCITAK